MSWPQIRFGDLYLIPSRNGLMRPSRVRGEGVKMVNMGELFANQLIGDIPMERVPMNERELANSSLAEGDLLFARQSLVLEGAGQCSYIASLPEPTTFESHLIRVRLDQTKATPLFYHYYFRSPYSGMSTIVQQCAQAGIRASELTELKVGYPPIEVQKAVVDLLAPYDSLIENNRRRMALLEGSARLLYREWFVRLRFPGYENTPIVDGVPQGWERRTAFDSMKVLSGGTPKTTTPDYWDGETPFFTPRDAIDGIWVSTCERSVTELGIKNCNSKLYPRGTVFITARGTVGKLNMAQVPMAMSQSCYALVGKDHLSQPFIYSAIEAGVDALRQQAVGAVFDAIVVDTFKRIKLMVPPAPMLRLFDEAVASIFDQVENLASQNQKLRAARDLLLPRLMSGELAV